MTASIVVKDVKKKFKLYYDKAASLKEATLFGKRRSRHEERWVLKGVSFEVKRGEAIGIIGENGCGKSTLLKLMTQIMYPDSGSIEITGRVSSLIELGAGFHADMSGRENIYTNAAIFGLKKSEIDRRLDDIIAFSELEEFIDNPVRTYSSGMYMRLAFAVAINVDADVLLVDEILAVGDASFQAKCFNKLRAVKASGTTIAIVSHSLGQIEQICDRTLWINEGVIYKEGLPREVHPEYLEFMGRKQYRDGGGEVVREEPEQVEEEHFERDATEASGEGQEEGSAVAEEPKGRWGDGSARISRISIRNSKGETTNLLKTGESFQIEIAYATRRSIADAGAGIGVFRNDGVQCYGTNTFIDQMGNLALKDSGMILCDIREGLLLEGEYALDVAIHDVNGFAYDYWSRAVNFQVYSEIKDVGVMRMAHVWLIK